MSKLESLETSRKMDGIISKQAIFMKTLPMRIVGQLRQTPWQRFIRLQRTAAQLAAGKGQPKGVYRFASYEECAAWAKCRKRN
jgi:hypothetical protein